jgi:hypothetical protein
MKLTEKTKYLFASLIYLSFAFDSLLKVNIGVKIHIGILLMLFFNIFYFFRVGFKNKIKLLKIDKWLILFAVYALFSGLFNVGLDSLFIFFYLFLALNVYFFIKKNIQYITDNTIYSFHLLLIITGLIQFLLVMFFDYQLNFLGIDHYSKGSSVTYRLRGFFVEPNWFAIAFSFNFLLLVKNDVLGFIKKHTLLFVFTLLVLVFNGSYGTLAVLVITYGFQFLKKNVVAGIVLAVIGSIGFFIMLEKRAEFKKGKSGLELFNYYSRTEPFNRVNSYFEDKPLTKKIFGEGLGSWGTIAIENRLSVLTYDVRKYVRDSSELHVFLFELGLMGTFLFFLDIFYLYRRNLKPNFYINGAISLFVISFLLYPVFKFLMYMVYFFIIRVLIQKNKKEELNKKLKING